MTYAVLGLADLKQGSPEYLKLKEERSQVLWKAVERVIPDIRKRTEIEMVSFGTSQRGTPHLIDSATPSASSYGRMV